MSLSENIPVLPPGEIPPWLENSRRPFHRDMFAMYSSEFNGIITEPLFMVLPIDDHLVHRGDGVFETLKCVNGLIYCFNEHLDRLLFSAAKIALTPPFSREEISRRILQTVRVAGHRDCLIRVLLSRGPGSMGISPYDCPRANLYMLVHKAVAPFMDTHPDGARVVTSTIPVKSGVFATIKTCNYLPNALLKKAAVDHQVDFAINFDEQENLAEGATENIGIISTDNQLVIPRPDRILAGTTMKRVFDLADAGIREGWLTGKAENHISRGGLVAAREILIFGTTTNVTAVTQLDGHPVGRGKPGPVFAKLSEILLREQSTANPYTTDAFA
jgi:branched-subunit amino acid aminotransferase/4-amino-4-deoxychorismate lyase